MTFLFAQSNVPTLVGKTRLKSPLITCRSTWHGEVVRPRDSTVPNMPSASNSCMLSSAAKIAFRVTPLMPSALTMVFTASRKAIIADHAYAPNPLALSAPVYLTKFRSIGLAFVRLC